MVARDEDRVAVAPDFAAVVERQATHRVGLGPFVVIEDIDAAVADRRAGITFAHLHGPEESRSLLGPRTGQAGRGVADAVVSGASEPGPTAGKIRRLAIATDRSTGHGRWQDLVARTAASRRQIHAWNAKLQIAQRSRLQPPRNQRSAEHRQQTGEQQMGPSDFHEISIPVIR